MSNLHKDLDEANLHAPKGFTLVGNNTRPWKNELGESVYTENNELPRAINFVDGTAVAPSSVDGDIFVIIGSGVLDGSWGTTAAFGDWVRAENSIFTPITPVKGMLCYDDTASSWMEFDGTIWAVFGGGGGTDTNLQTNDLILTDPSRFFNINGNDLQFKDGASNRIRINSNGVAIGNTAAPVLGTALNVVGSNALSSGIGLNVENSTGLSSFKFLNDGKTVLESSSTSALHTIQSTAAAGSSGILFRNDVGGVGFNMDYSNTTGLLQYISINAQKFRVADSSSYKWSFSIGDDANTYMKLTPTALFIGGGIGAATATARLHVDGAVGTKTFRAEGASGSFDVLTDGKTVLESSSTSALQTIRSTAAAGSSGILFKTAANGTGANIDYSNTTGLLRYISINAQQFQVADSSYYKWNFALGDDANTDMKMTPSGLLIGNGIGASTPSARLHVIGTIRSDQTTVLSKTISTDFLPINVNGTVRYLALYD